MMEQVCESGVADESVRVANATQVLNCRCHEIYVAIRKDRLSADLLS
jgi:hypothetical protein